MFIHDKIIFTSNLLGVYIENSRGGFLFLSVTHVNSNLLFIPQYVGKKKKTYYFIFIDNKVHFSRFCFNVFVFENATRNVTLIITCRRLLLHSPRDTVGLVECLLNQLAVSGWSQSLHVSDGQLIFRRLGHKSEWGEGRRGSRLTLTKKTLVLSGGFT